MAKYMLSKLTPFGPFKGAATLGSFNKLIANYLTDASARRHMALFLESSHFEDGEYGIFRSPMHNYTDGIKIHTLHKGPKS